MSVLDSLSVSVIIPCFNHARFLEQRLFSIVNQTFQPSQIIFLDDCSSDGSYEFASKYLENHLSPSINLSLIQNNKNSGSPFVQWSKGLNLATSDFVWIAESDDACDLTFLEILLTYILSSGSSICFSQSTRINSKGDSLGTEANFTQKAFGAKFMNSFSTLDGKSFVRQYGLIANPIPNASAALIKRECFVNLLSTIQYFRYAGDWYLWLQLIHKHGLAYCSQPLNYFRCHSDTTRSLGCATLPYFAENLACRMQAIALSSAPQYHPIYKSLSNFIASRTSYLRALYLIWHSLLSSQYFSFSFLLNVRIFYNKLCCIEIKRPTWFILFLLHYLSAPFIILRPFYFQVRYYCRRLVSLIFDFLP